MVSLHPPGHPAVPPVLPHREQLCPPNPETQDTPQGDSRDRLLYFLLFVWYNLCGGRNVCTKKTIQIRVQSKKQKDLSQRIFNILGLHSYTLSMPQTPPTGCGLPLGWPRDDHMSRQRAQARQGPSTGAAGGFRGHGAGPGLGAGGQPCRSSPSSRLSRGGGSPGQRAGGGTGVSTWPSVAMACHPPRSQG